jgi:hypothetical protein
LVALVGLEPRRFMAAKKITLNSGLEMLIRTTG